MAGDAKLITRFSNHKIEFVIFFTKSEMSLKGPAKSRRIREVKQMIYRA
jgi:hypothetical protein